MGIHSGVKNQAPPLNFFPRGHSSFQLFVSVIVLIDADKFVGQIRPQLCWVNPFVDALIDDNKCHIIFSVAGYNNYFWTSMLTALTCSTIEVRDRIIYLDDTLSVHLSRNRTGCLDDSRHCNEDRSSEMNRTLAVLRSNCTQQDFDISRLNPARLCNSILISHQSIYPANLCTSMSQRISFVPRKHSLISAASPATTLHRQRLTSDDFGPQTGDERVRHQSQNCVCSDAD